LHKNLPKLLSKIAKIKQPQAIYPSAQPNKANAFGEQKAPLLRRSAFCRR